MSKFNKTIKNYVEEQNITFNPNAASSATIAPNQQLKNAAEIMNDVSTLLQGQKNPTPEELEKAVISALEPFGVKKEDAYKVLETLISKKQGQTQQPEQTDTNKTSTQQNTTQPVNQQQSQNKSQSNTYTASAPKA